MRVDDREYFLMRAEQERDAAAHSMGPARGRHEEMASIYQLRILYIDHERAGDADYAPDTADSGQIQQFMLITAA
jgi:hypothetical protein